MLQLVYINLVFFNLTPLSVKSGYSQLIEVKCALVQILNETDGQPKIWFNNLHPNQWKELKNTIYNVYLKQGYKLSCSLFYHSLWPCLLHLFLSVFPYLSFSLTPSVFLVVFLFLGLIFTPVFFISVFLLQYSSVNVIT